MKVFKIIRLWLMACMLIFVISFAGELTNPDKRVLCDQAFAGPPPGPAYPDLVSTYRKYWPPSIDGIPSFFEWMTGSSYHFDHGFMSVCNDAIRLYIHLNVLGDTEDDAGDTFSLTFDVNGDGRITEGVDLNFTLIPGTHNMRYQHYAGPGSLDPLEPGPIRSSVGGGFGCFHADGTKVTYIPDSGLAPVCMNHRVWEFGIDLQEIGAEPGELVKMGFRAVSETPSFTDNVPEDFDTDFSDLIEIRLAPIPVDIREGIPEPDPEASLDFDEAKSGGIIIKQAIEVTQAIQDRMNTLPLVEDKTTAARVYVEVDGVGSPQPAIAYLYGTKDGDDLPGSPLSILFVSPAAIDRGRLSHSANFRLPRSWLEGTIEFDSQVYDLFGARQDTSGSFLLTFEERGIPNYWIVPMRVETPAGELVPMREDINLQESYLKTVYPVPDIRFVRLDPEFTPLVRTCGGGGCVKANAILQLNLYYDSLLLAGALGENPLPDQMYGIIYTPGGRADPTWSPYEPGRGLVSVGNARFTPLSLGVEHDWYNESTIAHEINHNLDTVSHWTVATWGRHVGDPNPCTWYNCPCGAGDALADCERIGLPGCESEVCLDFENKQWGCGGDLPDPDWPRIDDHIYQFGFDTRLPWIDGLERMLDPAGYPEEFIERHFTVVPGTCPDFMSYCDSKMVVDDEEVDIYPGSWISPYRWERLFDVFPPDPPFPPATMTVLWVSGEIRLGGGILYPALIHEGFPTESVSPGGWDYAIEIQDVNGYPLLSKAFPVAFTDHQGEKVETVGFHFQIPLQEEPQVNLQGQQEQLKQLSNQHEISKIILKKMVNQEEQILDEIVVSDNAPSVSVLAPAGGENWQGIETIKWEAEDQDEDTLSFTILYSPDNGNSWFPVAWSVQGESYEVNESMLPGGNEGRIRVIVTDGFNTAEADSEGTFVVPGKPPKIFITRPKANSHFFSGEEITFEGEASDLEDDLIPDASFVWSYGSTVFGEGRNLSASLPAGLHEVTLTVFDSHENITRTVVLISVTSEMECFEVNHMKVIDKKWGRGRHDKIRLQGSMKLADDIIPFDPGKDVFTVAIDDKVINILEGSFKEKFSRIYVFQGYVHDVGYVKIHLNFNTCRWRIEVLGLEVSQLIESSRVTVNLGFGLNIGYDEFPWTKKWNGQKIGTAWFFERPPIQCCQKTYVGNDWIVPNVQ